VTLPTLLFAALLGTTPAADLPADPFQRAATRALRGDYGELQAWQRAGYQRGLQQGVMVSRCLVLTQFNGREASGKIDRRGRDCTMRTAASNIIPENSYIWTERTGLRQVLDTGASSNDRKARGIGGTWVDIWFPTASHAREAGIDGWRPVRGAVVAH
jgi:3D (Asp-Asp-Asp) domain-containing protein